VPEGDGLIYNIENESARGNNIDATDAEAPSKP